MSIYTVTMQLKKVKIEFFMNTNKSFIFYPLMLIFFVVDILSSLVIGRALIASMISLFAVIVSRPINWFRLMLIFVLLGIESFFFYGQWGIQLIYLVPIAMLARRTYTFFASPLSMALIVLIATYTSQFIANSLFGEFNTFMFTVSKIFINIVLTMCISLTYINKEG